VYNEKADEIRQIFEGEYYEDQKHKVADTVAKCIVEGGESSGKNILPHRDEHF
jgi:hypothetical protein